MNYKTAALAYALLFWAAASIAAPRPKLAGENVPLVSSDGWKITAQYSPPPDNGRVILFIHSLGKNKDEWEPLASRVAKLGYGYLALDLRGHGESRYDMNGKIVSFKEFSRNGTTNEFNQMTRDIEAAIDFLAEKQIGEDRIVLAGSGLGANLAVRTAAVCPTVPMMLLIGPTLNAGRDVLTVNPLRAYGKRPVLIIVAQTPKKIYDESVLLKSVAQLAAGAENVTFITEYKGAGTELLNFTVLPRLLQWLKTPVRPPEVSVVEYTVLDSTSAVEDTEQDIAPETPPSDENPPVLNPAD